MTYMLIEDDLAIANEWKQYAHFTVRPQASTVRFYEKYISLLSNTSIAMLYGGTPEVREIFRRIKHPLTLVDRSSLMLNAMGKVINPLIPISSNETPFISDWLTIPIMNQTFDFIIADDAINMVDWVYFDIFLQKTHALLNENGIFICHLLVKPDDELIDKSLDEVIDEYCVGNISSIYELASRVNYLFYEKSTYRMGWQQTINMLGSKGLDKIKKHFDFQSIFSNCNSVFYCPPIELFEELILKYFEIELIFYSSEHAFCQYEPVYVLRKRAWAE